MIPSAASNIYKQHIIENSSNNIVFKCKSCGHYNKEVAELYTDCMAPNRIRIIGKAAIIDEDTTGFYTVLGHSFVQEQLGSFLPEMESLYRFLDDKTVAIELIIDLLHNAKEVPKELVSWLWNQL